LRDNNKAIIGITLQWRMTHLAAAYNVDNDSLYTRVTVIRPYADNFMGGRITHCAPSVRLFRPRLGTAKQNPSRTKSRQNAFPPE